MSKQAAKAGMSIGAAIRTRRAALRLSQRDLARAAGTTAAAISHIERGARNLSAGLLVRIADALQCSANDLLIGTSAATVASTHIGRVAAAMKGFPPPLQQEVVDFCEYLKHRSRKGER